MTQRSRNWTFTINNYVDDDYTDITSMDAKYVIVGDEVGDDGTPHYQGYVSWPQPKSLKQMKVLLPRAHLEIAVASAEVNREYCSKDTVRYEHGTCPMSQADKGAAGKASYEETKALALEGRIDEVDASHYIRHYHTLKKIALDHAPKPDDLDDVCGVWYYGVSGIGKSRKARLDFPHSFFKSANDDWWDGYQDEKTVIIDDLDKFMVKCAYNLKIWADRYSFWASIKGLKRHLRPEVVCVTSQYSIDQIWEDEETRAALRRRFKVVHFSTSPFSQQEAKSSMDEDQSQQPTQPLQYGVSVQPSGCNYVVSGPMIPDPRRSPSPQPIYDEEMN